MSSLRKDMFIKDIPILTHVITSNDIKNTAYSNVKDILEMTLPNVQNVMSSRAGISNNRVKIQGLDNRYLLFLVDDKLYSSTNVSIALVRFERNYSMPLNSIVNMVIYIARIKKMRQFIF